PETMIEFAAVKGDRVYAVGADNAMWEWSPPRTIGFFHFGGWQQLSGPGTVKYLDAVTQTSGYDAVFAIRQDGSLQKFSQGSWQWLAVPNYFVNSYYSFSAGLDTNGTVADNGHAVEAVTHVRVSNVRSRRALAQRLRALNANTS